ncbi:hypothetical protein [Streptomyces sp. NPDC003720]|uniref:hypothetical protein n=1 Tax=Streptomyces sp. NPDC003720 TaxID=3364684 RepID=UPI00367E8BB7
MHRTPRTPLRAPAFTALLALLLTALALLTAQPADAGPVRLPQAAAASPAAPGDESSAVAFADEPCAGVRAARAAVRQEAPGERPVPHGPLAVAVPGAQAAPPGGAPGDGERAAAPFRWDRAAADRGRAPPAGPARA